MTTRKVFDTFLHSDETPWINARVRFERVPDTVSATAQFPVDPPIDVYTDTQGYMEQVLWANAEGLIKSTWFCTTPDGRTHPFVLPPGGDVALRSLFLSGVATNWPANTFQAQIDIHTTTADPHPQYLETGEADLLYAEVIHNHDDLYAPLGHLHTGVYEPVLPVIEVASVDGFFLFLNNTHYNHAVHLLVPANLFFPSASNAGDGTEIIVRALGGRLQIYNNDDVPGFTNPIVLPPGGHQFIHLRSTGTVWVPLAMSPGIDDDAILITGSDTALTTQTKRVVAVPNFGNVTITLPDAVNATDGDFYIIRENQLANTDGNAVIVQGYNGQYIGDVPTFSLLNREWIHLWVVNATWYLVDRSPLPAALPVVTTVTANTVVGTVDATILADATSGALTITLPDPATSPGEKVTVKKKDAGAALVTVVPSLGTIDGDTSFALEFQGEYVRVQSDGGNWYIIGG
jgi:hypothetical protein